MRPTGSLKTALTLAEMSNLEVGSVDERTVLSPSTEPERPEAELEADLLLAAIVTEEPPISAGVWLLTTGVG